MSSDLLFARPEALPALLAAPLAWLLESALDRVRARRLVRLLGPRADALAAEGSPRRRRLRRTLAATALLLTLLAGTQPLGEQGRALVPRGTDLVLCLDVSRSMLAQDVPPSRLAAAQRQIRALAEHVRGDRLGLVPFAGEALARVPLTTDAASLADLAEQAGPLDVPLGGTDLGAALSAALLLLEGRADGPAAVLLLTDGEDLAASGEAAAVRLAARGIPVHCVGLGSTRGSKIALPDEEGGAFLTDRSGREVVSALDAEGLARIAAATGGTFVEAGGDPRALIALYDEHVLPRARAATRDLELAGRSNLFQWPLLAAFLLWMLALCLTERSKA